MDTIIQTAREPHPTDNPYRFSPRQLIVPGVLIGTGVIGLETGWLKFRLRDADHKRHDGMTIDDVVQYAPIATLYGLNIFGCGGRHKVVDQTILLATSAILMGVTAYSLKAVISEKRPDGSDFSSFPSGHSAVVFMGAELLRREYWQKSPWIGVGAYAVATGIGFSRMYGNRHWLPDVLAGAGIGILSVQAAYWLYPVITKTFFKRRYLQNAIISPTVTPQCKGLAMQITF
ncbi:MAG: phosphatase PAP2 family protein [Staphylococcus sp.]|nr:phosphatase PAP2 family protein [Staphylococcus sp.]